MIEVQNARKSRSALELLPEDIRRAIAVGLGPYAITGEKVLARAIVALAVRFEKWRNAALALSAEKLDLLHELAMAHDQIHEMLNAEGRRLRKEAGRLGITS